MFGMVVQEMPMNVRIQRVLLASAAFLAASPVFAQSARIVSQGAAYAYAEEREATEAAISKFLGAPARDGAQVVFFRQAEGGRGEAALAEGGKVLAQLPRQGYSAIVVAPGTHTFSVDGRTLTVDLAAGERQYVRIAGDGKAGTQLVASHALAFLRSRR
jgi:hypothetical protein